MLFSLIVTTCNRIDDLRRFFESIENQLIDEDLFEIIFINQSEFKLDSIFQFKKDINIREIPSPSRSLSSARNLGLSYSRGQIICFPDDDCWYENTLLNNVWNFFGERSDVDVLCVNVFDPIKNLSYGSRPINVKLNVNYSNLFSLPISVGIFLRNSFKFEGELYFREDLGAGTILGSGEETDLLFRLINKSGIVYYNGYLRVFHPVYDFSENDFRKYYNYGLGFGYLIGSFIKSGNFEFLYFLIQVLFRTTGGVIFNLFNYAKRNLYWNRITGVFKGLRISFSQK